MQIEKFDAFKETMNASYGSMSQPNTGQDFQADFSKSFEQTAFTDTIDLTSSKGYSINNNDSFNSKGNENIINREDTSIKENPDRSQRDGNNNKPEPVKDKTSDRPTEKTAEKTDQKEIKEKTDESQAQTKPGDNKATNKTKEETAQSVKEVLKKYQAQNNELLEIKENVNSNISKSRATDANTTAEKVIMKDIGEGKETGEKSTGEQPQEGKSEKGEQLEAKMMKSLEVEGKEGTATKNETKAQKNQNKQDNAFLNLVNDSSKDLNKVDETKVQKAANHQNLLQQYENLKERISDNVENSIKFLMSSGESKVTMQLQPPELGKVEVELFMKDKQISAKINTENIAVKEVILSNLDQLKSNLANAGNHIDKFEVEVGGFKNNFDQHLGGEGNGSGKGGSGKDGDNMSSLDPNEPVPGKIVNHRATSFYLGRSINVVI
jgi:flagellar hook-length control protein FliK